MTYNLLTTNSGINRYVRKVNDTTFQILNTSYKNIVISSTLVFSVTTLPGGFLYLISGTDRTGTTYNGNYNPNLVIWDTDIIQFNITTTNYPLFISSNWSIPLVAPLQDTLINNNIANGVIKWYPGANNTGTFYYICSLDLNLSGQIIVIPNPNI